MVTTMREIERKYEFPAAAPLPDFGGLPGLSAQPEDTDLLDAEYFDTADLRLARAGITLRRRTGGSDAGWHLKIPQAPDTRDEIQLPADGADDQIPDELVERILLHSRGSELVPVARITTNRVRWLLRESDETVLAEVAVDTVSAHSMEGRGTAESWREVEVELVGGDRSLLERVDSWLTETGLHRAHGSKLARVLSDRLPPAQKPLPRPPKLRPKSAAFEVVHAYLRDQLDRLRAYDPEVRVDAPDAVHQMRITTRRLRSALRTYRDVLGADRADALCSELQWLTRVLGSARDAEVLACRLGEEVARLPTELVVGSIRTQLVTHFDRVHADAHRAARIAMRSVRYFALLDDLAALLGDPQPSGADRRAARKSLPAAVSKSYRRVRKAVRKIDDSGDDGRDVAIHQARKAAKRARYAAELAGSALGKKARRFGKRMKKLQDHLGEHQDSVVARAAILRLCTQAGRVRADRFTYGLLYGQELARANEIERDLGLVWRRAAASKYRKWLP